MTFTQLQYAQALSRLNKSRPSVNPPCEKEVGRGGLHEQIEDYCRSKGWLYVHSRTDKASTNQIGTCDFIIAADNGKTYWIEAKRKGGKPTSTQLGMIAWLKKLGHTACIVWSFEDFLDVVEAKNKRFTT